MQKGLYERYHSRGKLQKRIIGNKNFTYRHLIQMIMPYLKGRDRIVDVGCGVGTIDFYLAKKGKTVLGADISKRGIEMARLNAETFDISDNLSFKVVDFPKESIRGEKFDLALCISVLEHIKEDKKTTSAIFELLRAGGIAVFSVPSKNSPLFRLGLVRGHDKEVGHLRRYTVRGLSSLLRGSGFQILLIEKREGLLRNAFFVFPSGAVVIRIANRFGWASDLLTYLDNLFLKIFGEDQINVVARKK